MRFTTMLLLALLILFSLGEARVEVSAQSSDPDDLALQHSRFSSCRQAYADEDKDQLLQFSHGDSAKRLRSALHVAGEWRSCKHALQKRGATHLADHADKLWAGACLTVNSILHPQTDAALPPICRTGAE